MSSKESELSLEFDLKSSLEVDYFFEVLYLEDLKMMVTTSLASPTVRIWKLSPPGHEYLMSDKSGLVASYSLPGADESVVLGKFCRISPEVPEYLISTEHELFKSTAPSDKYEKLYENRNVRFLSVVSIQNEERVIIHFARFAKEIVKNESLNIFSLVTNSVVKKIELDENSEAWWLGKMILSRKHEDMVYVPDQKFGVRLLDYESSEGSRVSISKSFKIRDGDKVCHQLGMDTFITKQENEYLICGGKPYTSIWLFKSTSEDCLMHLRLSEESESSTISCKVLNGVVLLGGGDESTDHLSLSVYTIGTKRKDFKLLSTTSTPRLKDDLEPGVINTFPVNGGRKEGHYQFICSCFDFHNRLATIKNVPDLPDDSAEIDEKERTAYLLMVEEKEIFDEDEKLEFNPYLNIKISENNQIEIYRILV